MTPSFNQIPSSYVQSAIKILFLVRFELVPRPNKNYNGAVLSRKLLNKKMLFVRFEPSISLLLTFAIAKSSSSSCSLTFRISSGLGLLISDLKNNQFHLRSSNRIIYQIKSDSRALSNHVYCLSVYQNNLFL